MQMTPHYYQQQMQARSCLTFVTEHVCVCVQSNFSGVGLRSAALFGLHPVKEYSARVRCGAQQNFWKWGSWSQPFTFRTKTYGKLFICNISLF